MVPDCVVFAGTVTGNTRSMVGGGVARDAVILISTCTAPNDPSQEPCDDDTNICSGCDSADSNNSARFYDVLLR